MAAPDLFPAVPGPDGTGSEPVPAPPATDPAGPAARTGLALGSCDGWGVDWEDVRAIRAVVADRLAAAFGQAPVSEEDRRQFGRAVIAEEVAGWAGRLIAAGGPSPGPAAEDGLAGAVFASVFGLGRLQPLVDEPDVENIEINGWDTVWLVFADGRIEPGPPVADSDEELVAELQFLAARKGRTLSQAKPRLHLQLPDGSRLAAIIETAERPQVVIRRHRLVRIGLEDLVGLGTFSRSLAAFVGAAVRARKNIIVTGPQNAGKTTAIRGLASQIPAMERLATIEKEFELGLHRLGTHARLAAFEAREGTSEQGADGRAAGQVGLADLVLDALRMNLGRLIVGEVRGDEVVPMLEAMTTGDGGSMCTLHARSAHDATERLVTLCGRSGVDPQIAYRVIAGAVDLIVNIRMVDESYHGGRLHRFVNQVVEIGRVGENGRPATTEVYVPGPDGRAVPTGTPPSWLEDLELAGFDREWLHPANAGWDTPLHTTRVVG